MTIGSNGPEDETPAPGTPGGPGPFSEDEIASVTGPGNADELDEVEAVAIEEDSDDEAVPDLETSFEKLISKSRKLSPDRIRTVIESVLFVAERPLSVEELYMATGIDREFIAEAINQLSGIHRDGISGIVLHEVAGGWQFRTDPHSGEYVRRYLRVKPQRLTRAFRIGPTS